MMTMVIKMIVMIMMKAATFPIPVWGTFSPFPAVVIDISPHLAEIIKKSHPHMINIAFFMENNDELADDEVHQRESKKLQLEADPFSAK